MAENGLTAVNRVIERLQRLGAWYLDHGTKSLTLSARDYATLKNNPTEAERCGITGANVLTYRGITLRSGPGSP